MDLYLMVYQLSIIASVFSNDDDDNGHDALYNMFVRI